MLSTINSFNYQEVQQICSRLEKTGRPGSISILFELLKIGTESKNRIVSSNSLNHFKEGLIKYSRLAMFIALTTST